MKTRGASLFKSLSGQLIVLLCILLFLALPSFSAPVPLELQPDETHLSSTDTFAFSAGEVTSGEPEAVLQLDKEQLTRLFPALLQHLYPTPDESPIIPPFYSFQKRNYGRNSILSKGP